MFVKTTYIFFKEKTEQIGTNVRARVFNAGLLAGSQSEASLVLRPTNSINVFRGFPWSQSKCCSEEYPEFFFIIQVYLQSVQVHSVNWLKEVDECLGEGRSLVLFCN
jgi:hypothetical protein